MAQNTPPTMHYYQSFHQGLNAQSAQNLVNEFQLTEARNAVIGHGFVSKRSGFKKYNTVAIEAIRGLQRVHKSDGTKEFLVCTDAKLYKDNNGTLSQVAFSGSLYQLAGKADFVEYKDRSINDAVLLADGGTLKVYNYTNISEITPHVNDTAKGEDDLNDMANLTKFRAIEIKKDRIFAAAHPTIKNRLHFCYRDINLGYAVYDYWPAAYFFDVATDDNDEIVQLKTFRDYIIIFCKRSIWALSGDGTALTDYNLVRINVPKGCIAPQSVQVVGNEIFYLSDEGVYAVFATSENTVSARLVSELVDPLINAIPLADREKAVATYNDHQYLLSFPDGTTFVYDTTPSLLSWSVWTNIKANTFLNIDGTLYFGAEDGVVYQFDKNLYNDDGQAIDFFIRTKNHDLGKPTRLKQLISLVIKAKQYEAETSLVDLTVVYDGAEKLVPGIITDTTMVWDEGEWDVLYWDYNEIATQRRYVSKQGREIQYTIQNNYLNQPCTIYQIDTQYMTLQV